MVNHFSGHHTLLDLILSLHLFDTGKRAAQVEIIIRSWFRTSPSADGNDGSCIGLVVYDWWRLWILSTENPKTWSSSYRYVCEFVLFLFCFLHFFCEIVSQICFVISFRYSLKVWKFSWGFIFASSQKIFCVWIREHLFSWYSIHSMCCFRIMSFLLLSVVSFPVNLRILVRKIPYWN